MSFKLNFAPANDRGFLRADFKDRNGEACSMQESSLQFVEGDEDGGPCIWLGQNTGTHHRGECLARMHLTREMAHELARALSRFYRFGTLEELPPEEQLAGIQHGFDEAEEYDKMADAVVELARKFVICKSALSQAYKEGHKVTGEICNELRAAMNKAESALDKAVGELDEWRIQHGWPESAEAMPAAPQ